MITIGWQRASKLQDIAMTHIPDKFCQCTCREGVRLLKEDLIHFLFYKGLDHALWMTHKMNVFWPLEHILCSLEHCFMQRIGGCFIDQHAPSQALLQLAIKLLHRHVLAFCLRHQFFGCLYSTMLYLHQGSDGAFQPEAIATLIRLPALFQGVERQQSKLW